jgi:hypothetical protein
MPKSKSKLKSNDAINDLDPIINVNVNVKNEEYYDVEVCENCGAEGECYSDCEEFDYVKVCEACNREKCKPGCEYYGLPDESNEDENFEEDEECEYCGAGPGEDCASDCEGGSEESDESEGDNEDVCEVCGASPDEECYSDCDCEECAEFDDSDSV